MSETNPMACQATERGDVDRRAVKAADALEEYLTMRGFRLATADVPQFVGVIQACFADASAAEANEIHAKVMEDALRVVDECYEATGHIRVARSSIQRMSIEAAIHALRSASPAPQPAPAAREDGRDDVADAATYICAIADAASISSRADTQIVDHMVRIGGITPDREPVRKAMRQISSPSVRQLILNSWKRMGLSVPLPAPAAPVDCDTHKVSTDHIAEGSKMVPTSPLAPAAPVDVVEGRMEAKDGD